MSTGLLKYAGSKKKIAERVASYFADVQVFAEPLAGSAAVSLRLAELGTVSSFYLADASPFTYAWWRAWRVRAEGAPPARLPFATPEAGWPETVDRALFLRCRSHLTEVEIFRAIMNEQLGAPYIDFLRWMNHASHNGLIRYNRNGHFNTPPAAEGQTIAPVADSALQAHIKLAQRLRAVERSGRGLVLALEAFVGRGRLGVYADPPYIGGFTAYGPSGWGPSDLADLAACLVRLRQKHPDVVIVLSEQVSDAVTGALGPSWTVLERWERPGTMSAKGDGRQPVAEALYGLRD
jgi:DNA adenine methylase